MEKISITRRRRGKYTCPSFTENDISAFPPKSDEQVSESYAPKQGATQGRLLVDFPTLDEHVSERHRHILGSLVPIFSEIVTLYYAGNRKYMIEIVSGYEKPFKVVISSHHQR